MSKEPDWLKRARAANEQLAIVQKMFSRSGLFVTSLLLGEAVRVGQYEMHVEVERYKKFLKERKKK